MTLPLAQAWREKKQIWSWAFYEAAAEGRGLFL